MRTFMDFRISGGDAGVLQACHQEEEIPDNMSQNVYPKHYTILESHRLHLDKRAYGNIDRYKSPQSIEPIRADAQNRLLSCETSQSVVKIHDSWLS
jgi:hypothetical protein